MREARRKGTRFSNVSKQRLAYLCMESTRRPRSVYGDEDKADLLATMLLSSDPSCLKREFRCLIDILKRTNINQKEIVLDEWNAAIVEDECHPISVRFYVLMALVNPHFAGFVEELCRRGDRDRVVAFQRWVDIESTKLLTGVSRDYAPCTVPTDRVYPSVGVFVAEAMTVYGAQWDPYGERLEKRQQALYDEMMND